MLNFLSKSSSQPPQVQQQPQQQQQPKYTAPPRFSVRVFKAPLFGLGSQQQPAQKFEGGYAPAPQPAAAAPPVQQQQQYPYYDSVSTENKRFSLSDKPRPPPPSAQAYRQGNANANAANNFNIYPSANGTYIYEQSITSKSDVYSISAEDEIALMLSPASESSDSTLSGGVSGGNMGGTGGRGQSANSYTPSSAYPPIYAPPPPPPGLTRTTSASTPAPAPPPARAGVQIVIPPTPNLNLNVSAEYTPTSAVESVDERERLAMINAEYNAMSTGSYYSSNESEDQVQVPQMQVPVPQMPIPVPQMSLPQMQTQVPQMQVPMPPRASSPAAQGYPPAPAAAQTQTQVQSQSTRVFGSYVSSTSIEAAAIAAAATAATAVAGAAAPLASVPRSTAPLQSTNSASLAPPPPPPSSSSSSSSSSSASSFPTIATAPPQADMRHPLPVPLPIPQATPSSYYPSGRRLSTSEEYASADWRKASSTPMQRRGSVSRSFESSYDYPPTIPAPPTVVRQASSSRDRDVPRVNSPTERSRGGDYFSYGAVPIPERQRRDSRGGSPPERERRPPSRSSSYVAVPSSAVSSSPTAYAVGGPGPQPVPYDRQRRTSISNNYVPPPRMSGSPPQTSPSADPRSRRTSLSGHDAVAFSTDMRDPRPPTSYRPPTSSMSREPSMYTNPAYTFPDRDRAASARSPTSERPLSRVGVPFPAEPTRRNSDPLTSTSMPPAEPHRRYSDGDTSRPGTSGSRSAASAGRNVRWNDNLICPSPVPCARRKGWFNRRGDQLWTNDGAYKPAAPGFDYPPDLDEYPEYGQGWMNEEGTRIDMGHRLIPKAPLRSALKQPKVMI